MSSNSKDRARSALLYDYLLHSTAEDIPATRDRLCEYLSCDRKTLAKEIAALKECGFDIRNKRVGKQFAYYYAKNDISLAEMQIWIDEAHAGSYIPEDDEDHLTETIEAIGGPEKAQLLQKSTVIFNAVKHADTPILRTVSVLQQAILNNTQATFLYFSWDENHEKKYHHDGERYVVEPIGLVNKDDNYYLLTYDPTASNSIRQFRLDRIDAAITAQEPVSSEAIEFRQNVSEYTRQAFRMYGGDTVEVTLQFTEAVINYIFDKFGRDAKIEKIDDDCFRTTVEVQVSPPFWGWMFQFSESMEIVGPEELRKEYEKRLTQTLDRMELINKA